MLNRLYYGNVPRELRSRQEVENLESLTNLEELWLGKNKITEIKVLPPFSLSLSPTPLLLSSNPPSYTQNISHLSTLKILDLKSNRLTHISNLSSLPSLEELYISHNALTAISPSSLSSNQNLRVLDISNNRIEHLEHLGLLGSLEELWASSNLLESFEEMERELRPIETLETVYFEGNPLQLKGPAVYRNKVKLALPGIRQIDASEFRGYREANG